MKKAIYRALGLAILAAGCWYGYRYYKQMPERQDVIPTAKVQRGDVVIRAFSRGEVRAARTVTLTAPNLFGTVQVTDLAPVGSLAREKDLIVEYDDSERQSALEEARLNVESVDEQIKKAKADLAITQSQDAVTLLKTRYNVRRAELDVQSNPILAEIDAKKNLLNLEQQKRALYELESDIKSRQAQADSQLAVLQEQRNRSLIDVQRELQRIAMCKTLAPITGLVAIKQNRAGMFNFGQQMPDIREGDTLQPGMPVADILDLSEVQVWAKVGELDRANLKEGQEATLQLDAIPDKRFSAKIKAMSGTATSDVFSGDPSKKFDVVFAVDMRQLLAGVGMKSADIERIMATAVANAKKGISAGGNPFAPPVAEGTADPSGGRGQPAGAAGRGERSPAAAGTGPQPGAAGNWQGRGARLAPAGTGFGGTNLAADDPIAALLRRASNVGGFTDLDRKNARLPLPPEQDSQVQLLLRPGLLADVEIQVEKLPGVLHLPAQAVFRKEGQFLVYVQGHNGKFQPRAVQLVKQSESMMVISSGVEAGEVVAMADPTAGKKKSGEKKSTGNGNAMGGMGGGK
jgi:multidrug resistance efflux pump